MSKQLYILDGNTSERVLNLASARGFETSEGKTDDWQMDFAEASGTHQGVLANASRLIESNIRSVLVINGPNLNLLGTREPEIYGTDTMNYVSNRCLAITSRANVKISFQQSNHEGEIVTWIQGAIDTVSAIVINAGAYTHTSIAIHDALKAFNGLVVELHISNPHQREPFRHLSYVTPAADAAAVGLGTEGYDIIVELLCSDDA